MSKPDDSQAKVEIGVATRFLDAFGKKVEEIQNKYYSSSNPTEFRLQKDEQQILMKINNGGLMEGALAGIASLIALRKMRSVLVRKAFQGAQQQRSGMTGAGTGTPHNPSSSNPMQQLIQQRQMAKQQQYSNNPFQKNSSSAGAGQPTGDVPRPGFFLNIMGWSVDAMFAFCVAVSVSMYRFDVDTLMEEVTNIPLSPGQSAVAREFCPDAITLLNQLREESKNGDQKITKALTHPESKNVTAMLKFARNCERRAKYEAVLREEKGVSKDYRVSIPEPGVPVGVDEDDESGNSSSAWVDDGSFSMDSSGSDQSNSWADGFVEDQEESSKK
mmetsp:Transcript_8818/g.11720  ORF Transcript_8818/g.11720 Transcript_8818/m.11720 type:complete len:330 (+) Transcript_8818:261-1250(+)